jgi:glycosyltransferase involved in cell wall biosynthesis
MVDMGWGVVHPAGADHAVCMANERNQRVRRGTSMKVMHVITRMIVGGAQENTLFNCLDLVQNFGDTVKLITGPTEGPEGKLLAQSNTEGLLIEGQKNLIRAISPVHDTKALRALKNAIRSWQPQVVHTHSAKAGLLGRAAAWSCGVPCVVHTVHGAPFHPYQRWASRWLFIQCERWAAKRCHHMISVADAMTDLMVEAQVAPRSMFTTIYSGMDVTPFINSSRDRARIRKELGFAETDIVFGKIARLFHLKGHRYVIEAAAQVCKVNPNVKFLFVGDGILRDKFEAEIANRGLQERFVFTGLVPPDQVPGLVGAMDALVHTSLREGLARAIPQAFIAGKPVISYDIDGAREVVRNGATGFLIPPEEIEPLASAINSLAESAKRRDEFGRRGRELFTDQFRHETMTQRIRELYVRLLSKG